MAYVKGTQLRVSSDRLVNPVIKPVTPVLQWSGLFTTAQHHKDIQSTIYKGGFCEQACSRGSRIQTKISMHKGDYL